MIKTLRASCAVLGCALAAVAALAQNRTFTSQYTFGDSLSDNGNAYAASGRTINTGALNFGGRWSNGPTFAELLGNTIFPAATISAARGNLDFAFGGATAVTALSTVPFPSLPVQLQMFQQQRAPIQSTDLFTVWMGANDILNTASQASVAAMAPAGINAANATANAIQTLIATGAKNILVLNMPDIGLTPAGLSSGGGSLLTAGSLAYNAEFDSRLRGIAASATDVTITRIDAAALIARIQADFRKLGFANATSGMTLPAASGGGGDPAGYAFFDGIHPSAKTHVLLANVVLEALNPEPVVGFAATQGTAALALRGLANDALDTRLAKIAATSRPVGRTDGYVSLNYGSGDRAADGWRRKFTYDAHVVTAGIDGHLSEGMTVGGAIETGRMESMISAGGGKHTVENLAGRLYGLWQGGPVVFAIDADYGAASVKGAKRTTAFGGFEANGKTSGSHWGVGAKAMWTMDGGGFSLRPWLGVRTERVKLDAYTERDVPSLTMAFGEQEAKSSAGSVGLDFASDATIVARAVHFDFSVAYRSEFTDKTRGVSGQLINNFTRPTVLSITDGNGSGVALGIGATLALNKTWSASLGYHGDIRQSDKLASRAWLSVQTGF